jgi:hypothetical protein
VRLRQVLIGLALTLAVAASAQATTGAIARGARIRTFANRWMGTPYAWGGASKGGIDCSAYLREMFRELFNVELPRTTRDQIGLGMDLPVDARNLERHLEPGDLIFYIDRAGIPNHVVVYMGAGQLTHSESGRGVVVDPMKKLWGRRIVARRLLVPAGRGGGFGPIPAAGPIVPKEVPCPASVVAKTTEVRQFTSRSVDIKTLGERDICDFRALALALRGRGGTADRNAQMLEQHAIWLENIAELQDALSPQ